MTTDEAPIPLAQLGDLVKPGEPLPFRLVDAQGRLLLAAGQAIQDLRQLQALLDRGAGAERPQVEAVRRQRSGGPAVVKAVYRRHLFDVWEAQLWKLDAALRALGAGTTDAAALQALADEHIVLVDRHEDAALFLCIRQDDKRYAMYSLAHALHTATVALLSARALGWDAAAQREVVAAALTMNAAIVELQARMAQQPDPPTARHLQAIREHPAAAVALLRAAGVPEGRWLCAVSQHHEQATGSGYPEGLADPAPEARLLRAADVFTAKISPRALRAAIPPQMAARQLFQEEAGSPLAAALIKAVGVYPPGDFVRLKNGETGVVMQRAGARGPASVRALLDARGRPLAQAQVRSTGEEAFAVAGALPAAERAALPRVLPESVYGLVEP